MTDYANGGIVTHGEQVLTAGEWVLTAAFCQEHRTPEQWAYYLELKTGFGNDK